IISVSERTTKKGTKMYIINLGDETGRIGMTIFEAAFEKLPPETKELLTTVGTEFETAIRIGEYRGEFQATILDYTKIKKLGTVEISEAEAASASANSGSSGFSNGMSANVKSSDIGDLNESSVNNVYKVKAGIAKFAKRKTKKGKDMYSLKLTDKTGSINVTIFDGDYNSMSASVKKIIETEGNEIEVALKISEYNGRIQGGIADVNSIKKTGTFDLDKSEDGEEESPKYKKKQDASEDAPVKKIGELTLADKGKSVKIEGAEIKFVSSNDKGMNLTLGDDSGKIKIMIWENMIEKIPGLADVEKGASISGIFAVDAYNEKLQLKIKNPKSIKIE
nr:hypothetical protein [bacterium]